MSLGFAIGPAVSNLGVGQQTLLITDLHGLVGGVSFNSAIGPGAVVSRLLSWSAALDIGDEID